MQKTAYELRISDWCSDACSSDRLALLRQSLRAARLRKLSQLGLADKLGNGRWRIADGIEDTLRRMGERGDIIRTMQRELTARRVERAAADRVIFDPANGAAAPIGGRVVLRGLADEMHDRHYLIVEDRKRTRLNSSDYCAYGMPSSACET